MQLAIVDASSLATRRRATARCFAPIAEPTRTAIAVAGVRLPGLHGP
jgi:hypothetical protein